MKISSALVGFVVVSWLLGNPSLSVCVEEIAPPNPRDLWKLERKSAGFAGLQAWNAHEDGVEVRVTPGSAADRAGLKTGDVIQEIDGKVLTHTRDLHPCFERKAPGDTVLLRVRPDRSIRVTLQDRMYALRNRFAAVFQMLDSEKVAGLRAASFCGITIVNVSDTERQEFGLPDYADVVVTDLVPESAKDFCTALPGIVFDEVGPHPVETVVDVLVALIGIASDSENDPIIIPVRLTSPLNIDGLVRYADGSCEFHLTDACVTEIASILDQMRR